MAIAFDHTKSHYTSGPFGAKGEDAYEIAIQDGFEVSSIDLLVVDAFAGGCRLIDPPALGAFGPQRLVVHWWYDGFGKIRYRAIVNTRRRAQYQGPRAVITLSDFHWVRDVEPEQPDEPYLVAIPFVIDARSVGSGAYTPDAVGRHGNLGYLWEAGDTRPVSERVGTLEVDAEPIHHRFVVGVIVAVADEDFTPAARVAQEVVDARRATNEALGRIVADRVASNQPVTGPMSIAELGGLQEVARRLGRGLTAPGTSWNPDDLIGTAVRSWPIDAHAGLHHRDEIALDGPGGACTIGLIVDAVDQSSPEGTLEVFSEPAFSGSRRTVPLALFETSLIHPWRFGSDDLVPRSVRWSLHPCSTAVLHANEGAPDAARELVATGEVVELFDDGMGAASTWRWYDAHLPIQPVQQERSSWCWAAVTSALATYYFPELPLEQCEIANRVFAEEEWDCCADLTVGNRTIDISYALDAVGLHHERLGGAPDAALLRDWLRSNRSAIAVIEWPNLNQHFVLVFGIDHQDNVWMGDSGGATTDVMPLSDALQYKGGRWIATRTAWATDRARVRRRARLVAPPPGGEGQLLHQHRLTFVERIGSAAESDLVVWRAFRSDPAEDVAVVGLANPSGDVEWRWTSRGPRIAAARRAFERGRVPRDAHAVSSCLDAIDLLVWDGEGGERLAWVVPPAAPGLPAGVVRRFSDVAELLEPTRAPG